MKLNGNAKLVITLVTAVFAAGVWYSTMNGVAERQEKHETRIDCLEEEYYEIQAQATEDYGHIRTEMTEEFGKIDSRLTGIETNVEFMKDYLMNGGPP